MSIGPDLSRSGCCTNSRNLNAFYARFNSEEHSHSAQELKDTLSSQDSENITHIQTEEVRKSFKSLNANKACGPDNIQPRILKTCADQLSPIYTRLFNQCHAVQIPSIWKTAKIIPVAKKPRPVELNDYRPIALTSVPFKCLERITLKRLIREVDSHLDSHQFAYRKGRSVEDATLCYVDCISKHLENRNSYARSLFIDFSSAFNTIIPHILVQKLLHLGVSISLCRFILDFLTDRTQFVFVDGKISSTLIINIGSPQGCVLSAVLFILYTNGLIAKNKNCYIIKYADDTAIIGLITDGNEEDYISEVDSVVEWCGEHNLLLNVTKTKELIFDFRKQQIEHSQLNINGSVVDIGHSYKYLGTIIDDKLSWSENTNNIFSKCMQRLYFLRLLRSFGIDNTILAMFYSSVIQSVVAFNAIIWWTSAGKGQQDTLSRIRKKAIKLFGDTVPLLDDIVTKNVIKKVTTIRTDISHPLYHQYATMRSNHRLRAISARTMRYRSSFIPNSIHLYNNAS